MALDGVTVANIVYELNQKLAESRINKIAQPETDELLLTLKTREGQVRLLISANPSLPLIYLTKENKPSPMTAPNFCMFLRKHIGSGKILSITQPGLERVIFIDVEHYDELGDLKRKRLVIELMGKHSNIIFLDDQNKILDSIKHVSLSMSSVREVLPGRDYFIPDQNQKRNPFDVSEGDFAAILQEKPMSILKALYQSFTGISPVIAEEICFLCGIDTAISPKDLSEDFYFHLYKQFHYFFENVRNNNYTPTLYLEGQKAVEFSSLTLSHLSYLREERYTSVFPLLFDYYEKKNQQSRIRQKSTDLRHIVQTALDRNGKKYQLQMRQLKDTEDRDKYKEYGELIHTYGYNLEEGAEKLQVLNYYTNQEVTISLDPQKTPQENATKYFDKYNKKKRTAEALQSLTLETKQEIDYLDSLSNSLDIAAKEEDLLEIKEELVESGYIRKRPSKKGKKVKNKPFHYLTKDGFHIYVGKNNLQNDELTFKFATGGDWWFHAKEAPGSHVILKTDDREIPDSAFEDAARLAAFYSKKRNNDKVEVDYSLKKNIKKPNKGKPGFVVYYTNYSIVVDSDISHLEQLD
ncbi:putative ribosome quality control (RQC) complex YloA/Tae2 family protein [Aequitasia blattaphilus]|uniref:Rqc2 homolog RqcH n=1 Tax=Aequitasia blattaphilus TaxID=2949332 RepID=A0ABT1E703_9FIRM|nr:NFACT family protein [Aequitasia blattaphilus]MCP1101553.1 NFACT family protein [Aequitasia blattaphilus]MCR8614193.1 NFACT family protein [Aequitasia blattaphilus]